MASTTIEDWTRSERYHNSFLMGDRDEALEFTLMNSRKNNLDDIAVSPAQGRLLTILATSINAKRILEIGTLGGYSTLCLARALPNDGEVLTLDNNPESVRVATENVLFANLPCKIRILLGPATENLRTISAEPPFDLVFIDADKESYPTYYQESKRLVRKGGLLLFDNVVRNGKVADPNDESGRVQGIRQLLALLKEDKDFICTTISTVGEKGYDGMLYAVKLC